MKIFQISPDDDEHSKDEEKGEGYFCSGWGRLRLGYLHWQELQGFSVYMTKYKYKYKYKLTNFWSILMSNALQGTSQHLSQLQKVFFISMFGTFMICTQLKPSSSLAFSQIVLWFYCRALESTQSPSPSFYFVRPRIWSHLIFTNIGFLTFIIIIIMFMDDHNSYDDDDWWWWQWTIRCDLV